MNIETNRPGNRFAFEGLGGSGKTHIMQILTSKLEDNNFSVLQGKISGMGTGNRIDLLKKIDSYREDLIVRGEATEKIIEDKRKDRIFRLAARYQVGEILKQLNNGSYDYVFLDRTPLMPWVYSSSVDSKNPYLKEMLTDGLETSRKIGLSTVYLFDLSPETALSRMMVRTCGSQYSTQEIKKKCDKINVPINVTETILEKVNYLITNTPNLQFKKNERYPFIPYDVLVNERKKFIEACEYLNLSLGVRVVTIDAEKKIEEVVSDIEKDLLQQS